jgi:hypothetical protein
VVPLGSVGENFFVNLPGSQFQGSVNLLIKLGLLGQFWTRNLLKSSVLTEEKQELRSRLEHTSEKPLRRLAQETGILKAAAKAMKLPELRPYKATSVHALQPRDSASKRFL